MADFNRLIRHLITVVAGKIPNKRVVNQQTRNRFPSHLIIVGLCMLIGVIASRGLTPVSATESLATGTLTSLTSKAIPKIEGTVDEVPSRFEFGQQLYLENCASCHVGVPPEVMPSQTWVDLLDDTQHYGVVIPPIVDPGRLIIWQYLEQFSRPRREDERTPYRIRNSRFFRILHPKVDFSEQVRLTSCVSCHPGAPDFNYRRLTPEWEDAP
ncbi:MAG: cytochrome C [Cyanobacteria bacterium P01_A01_bin.37]